MIEWTRERLDVWLRRLDVDAEDAAALAESMPSQHGDAVFDAFEKCRQQFGADWPAYHFDAWPPPDSGADTPLFRAHVLLSSLDALTDFHRHHGVPDDITRETFGDLASALRDHRLRTETAGIDATGWFVWLFRASHYRVGRLTLLPLRLLTAPDPQFWYDDETAAGFGTGFRRNDPVLSLHIPRRGQLSADECDTALERIATAFDHWFPDGPPRLAICTSWTLDPQIADYLPDDANLLHWQRRFTLIPEARDSDSIMSHVFDERPEYPLDELPQDTTLQRAVVTHLRNGKRWQVRSGWIDLQPLRN